MTARPNCGPLPHFRARDAAGSLRTAWVCEYCGGALGPYTDEQEARVRGRLAQMDRERDETQKGAK